MLNRPQGKCLTVVYFSPYTKLSYMFYAVNFVNLKVVPLMDFYIATNILTAN